MKDEKGFKPPGFFQGEEAGVAGEEDPTLTASQSQKLLVGEPTAIGDIATQDAKLAGQPHQHRVRGKFLLLNHNPPLFLQRAQHSSIIGRWKEKF